jgi:5'-nucleotidase
MVTTPKKNKHTPTILVSNDDGIAAAGLHVLVKELKKIGEVIVVAPDRQQSAVGHAITMQSPLRFHKHYVNGKFFGYAVEGTPADAVKLSMHAVLKKKPDIIVSGINHGGNTAISILYSGTVSAATEGTILGIPSLAISLTTYAAADFRYAAKFTRMLVKKTLRTGLPKGVLLNVNIPPLPEKEILGVRITRQGQATWNDWYDVRRDPGNREYFWLTGSLEEVDLHEDVDQWAVTHQYISVTPIQYDLTDYKMLDSLKRWNLKK